ncbi:hypothetical protein LUZ63_009109 [Rhynchospora breviuscula]|uniref:Uncharacterized protein n=1 Tax=Rhynchospora breviuscula TaxID=2022672 RepID=A0A9Q0HN80_9POAL|nr:hypothetical protein LUZ63_009109 [Rhynchospora breviuscula]
MEGNGEKSLERIVSQKALQLSSSNTCKVWILGFFCGVCFIYLFVLLLSPFWQNLSLPVNLNAHNSIFKNLSFSDAEHSTKGHSIIMKEDVLMEKKPKYEGNIMTLYNAWSSWLDRKPNPEVQVLAALPTPPHLEDCEMITQRKMHLDNHAEDGSFPDWTLKGSFGRVLHENLSSEAQISEWSDLGLYPPWIEGSDEDNYPLTRTVQRDIWLHQHPPNCKDPNIRFLVADWERLPGFGIGAQLAGMIGLLAIAIKENRVLVTNFYNRADHPGCQGTARSHWSCYFFPETSADCRNHAIELIRKQEALTIGIVKVKENYTSKEIWSGHTPRIWGTPWRNLQSNTQIDGKLLKKHRKMDRRWWRAQAVRYLMRFKTKYMCQLLNEARHEAFGLEAAKLVTDAPHAQIPKGTNSRTKSEMELLVWSDHKPWVPRPLLSLHVRMGDKACEMKVFEFEKYMELANQIRQRFPDLKNIWLSTEMQEVIDKTSLYRNWNFYYTNVTRQTGNKSMAAYEASLGRQLSTNYPLVNFLLATEADFFVGALGSSWCYLIDGMRNTGGKVMAGYLSVNKDRFW